MPHLGRSIEIRGGTLVIISMNARRAETDDVPTKKY
jgi:hypothetical protein